jgi:hypothetical protein
MQLHPAAYPGAEVSARAENPSLAYGTSIVIESFYIGKEAKDEIMGRSLRRCTL